MSLTALVLPLLREDSRKDGQIFAMLPEIRKAGAPYRLYITEETQRSGAVKARNRLFHTVMLDPEVENIVSFSSDIIEMPQNWLLQLLILLGDHPEVGSLAPYQLVHFENRPECPGWGNWAPNSGGSRWLRAKDIVLTNLETVPSTEFATCFTITRREVFDKIGYLDEGCGQGQGGDAQDFAIRIWAAGWENVYTTRLMYKHDLSNEYPRDAAGWDYFNRKWPGWAGLSDNEVIARAKGLRNTPVI